jgi:hypothetical protein
MFVRSWLRRDVGASAVDRIDFDDIAGVLHGLVIRMSDRLAERIGFSSRSSST